MTGEKTHQPSEEDVESKAPAKPKAAVKGGLKWDEPYGTVRSDGPARYHQGDKFFDSQGKPIK